MRIFLIAGTSLCLAGCVNHYVAPAGGATATLVLAAPMLDQQYGPVVMVQNFANDRCEASPDGNRLATFTTTSPQGKGDPHDGVARIVRAGQPVVFTFRYQEGVIGITNSKDCQITESFVPAPGGRYRAVFDLDSRDKECVVYLKRDDGDNPKDLDGFHEVKPACNNTISG